MESGTGDGSGSGFSGTDDYESLISTTDAELLKRAWRNEKAAPEILHFEAALVQRSREQIQLMEETVEEFTKNGVEPPSVSLYQIQMDLDRTLFLLRSYLRTRLQKMQEFLGAFQLDDNGVEKPVDLEANDLYALRYKSIKPLVESGQIDLV